MLFYQLFKNASKGVPLMAVSTFKRGLKLDTRKHATEGKAVEIAPMPKRVAIPINQHFGAPNKVMVSVGDKVRRGQRIAEGLAPGPMTVPVHASINGVVKRIEPRPQSSNTEGLCVVIEADPADAQTEDMFMPPLDPNACSKEEAIGRVRDAGIIGMGGAGFPTHVKLSPPPNKPIDLIIANGAECEPYLTTDETVMNEKPGLLVKGLAIVMKITGVNKAIIGIEDNKAELIPVIEKEVRQGNYPGEIKVGLCRTLYPQGGEKMLITALTGREVPSGGLPMDSGCIVSNVGTLVAIAEAFTLGKPLIDRDLTVSGGACKTPKNIRVPVGAILTDLPEEFMQIDFSRLRKVLYGGPMMGSSLPAADAPIQKNTSGIVLMTREELIAEEEGVCIRCGRCIRNCAMRLSPVVLNNALDADNLDEAVMTGLLDCMECGTCSYMCPARIMLTQRFRIGKHRLRNRQQLAKEAQEVAKKAAEANVALFRPATPEASPTGAAVPQANS
jgi:electron transport complex protein RnfC